jgi:hypothetical protein
VLLPCPLHVLLPRYPRFLGAGLHLSHLSHFRGPAQAELLQEEPTTIPCDRGGGGPANPDESRCRYPDRRRPGSSADQA